MRISPYISKQYFNSRITRNNCDNNDNNSVTKNISDTHNNTPHKIIIPHSALINLNRHQINFANSISNTEITRDNFTKLRDKSCLLKKIEDKKTLAIEQGKNLQVAMIDMDNFKSINEILGYETGDVFIKRISEIVRKNASENNLGSYRFGGEEFVIMDVSNSTEKLTNVCQKIKENISSDEQLNSYTQAYQETLATKLATHSDKNEVIKALNEMTTQLKLLKRIFEKDPELKLNKTLSDEYDNLFASMSIYTKALLSYSIKNADSNVEARVLSTALDKLTNGSTEEQISIMRNSKLRKYFDDKYNKQVEVNQILKWQNDFRRNAFGITCGIANMQKEYFENTSALDIVNTAGEVLKDGKATKKGDVYIQNFPQEIQIQ